MLSITELLTLTKAECETYVEEVTQGEHSPHKYVFVDNKAPVTLFAHMDTINDIYNTKLNADDIITNGTQFSVSNTSKKELGADDRAGIYIMLQLIKAGCIEYNYVFTQDEEIGGIGATAFAKDYAEMLTTQNAFISLDRRGANEVALYGYDNDELNEVFLHWGFITAFGSYMDCVEASRVTDIACLNISVGYDAEHTSDESLDFAITLDVLDLLQEDDIITALSEGPFMADPYVEEKPWYDYGLEDLMEFEPVVCEVCNDHAPLYDYEEMQVCQHCVELWEDSPR